MILLEIRVFIKTGGRSRQRERIARRAHAFDDAAAPAHSFIAAIAVAGVLFSNPLAAQTVDPCHPPFAINVVRTACRLGTAEARVKLGPGVAVHWQLTGGTITAGQDTANAVLGFFGTDHATLTATVTADGCTANSSVGIALEEPFAVDALAILPDPPILNAPTTIVWRYRGTEPARVQHLRVGDVEVPLRDGDRSYTFTPTVAGALRVSLTASTIAPVGRRRAVSVGEPLPPYSLCTNAALDVGTSVLAFAPPSIDYFTADSTSVPGDSSTALRFGLREATDWTLSSSLHNGFSQPSGAGSGPFAVTFYRDEIAGHDTITLTASGPGGTATASLIIYNPPYILDFRADASTVPVGSSTMLRFRIGQTDRWTMTSSRGNAITPATGTEGSGVDSGVLTATYQRSNPGNDVVTLTVTGLGGTTSMALPIQ